MKEHLKIYITTTWLQGLSPQKLKKKGLSVEHHRSHLNGNSEVVGGAPPIHCSGTVGVLGVV